MSYDLELKQKMNEIDINKISVYQDKDSTQIKYIKRCEVCKFAKLDLLSNKLCCIERDFDFVENFQCCSIFKLDKKFRQQMIDECVGVFDEL